jgi:flotillin
MAEADKYAKVQAAEAVREAGLAEAEAIKAKGLAEAEAIKASALAEAEGLREKAEAMKQYGDAAREQMQLDTLKVYFEQLPAIAKAVGEGYQNVDKIYMYGGETSKLAGDIMTNMSQVSEGLSQSIGIDIKSLLAGMVGGKMVSGQKIVEVEKPVVVEKEVVRESASPKTFNEVDDYEYFVSITEEGDVEDTNE